MPKVRLRNDVSKSDDVDPPRLTTRETEVLRLMAEGYSSKAIAANLNIHFKTAANHRGRILGKLRVANTVSAVRWAISQGIVAP